MDHVFSILSSVPPIITYIAIFLIVFVEGEIILLIAGIMARDHIIGFLPILLIAFAAAILHDLLYWEVGRRLARMKGGRIFFVRRERIDAFLSRFRNKSGIYLFITKFTWGLTRLALIAAGYSGRSRDEILRYSVPASLIWTVSLISLGYVFAAETHLLRKDIRTATLLVSGFVAGVLLLEYFVKRILRSQND